jgi:uncharacterized protein
VKFHLQTTAGQNLFTGHGAGYVAVNGTRYTKSILVTPDRIIEDWSATDFASLSAEHFAQFLALKPDLVLLGTGATFRFPRPEFSQPLYAAPTTSCSPKAAMSLRRCCSADASAR